MPLVDWASTLDDRFYETVSNIFKTTLFELGGRKFSLGAIGEFAALFGVILLIARIVKTLFKNMILARFGLDLGSREALASIVSYGVTILGTLIALQSVGIDLSSLTVFAGALGIGFGIGLQNIASNFASGIVLLFERPIKVGDFIQVGDLSGTVEEISIRSAIIRTNDGVCAIIPNSHFLENQVTNWSYKDQKSRIHVAIDVDSGAEPLLVSEALVAAARRHPDVLNSPPPEARFNGYQEGMDFQLLVWTDKPTETENIQSDLFFLIDEEMRKRDIKQVSSDISLDQNSLNQLGAMLMGKPMLAEAYQHPNHPNTALLTEQPQPPRRQSLSELLQQISFFQKCTSIELRRIIERGYQKTLEAEATICRENDPGDSFYIILSGLVEVYVESINKQVATRKPGEFIGEMSLLLGTPRTATLRTLEETTLFVVDRDNLKSLLLKHPDLADTISQELLKRQESLEKLGITVAANQGEPAIVQIRKHIRMLFGV